MSESHAGMVSAVLPAPTLKVRLPNPALQRTLRDTAAQPR